MTGPRRHRRGELRRAHDPHRQHRARRARPRLRVTSANPARYLDHFGASFSLPPNQGSPITKVHYDVVDAAGEVVVPEKVLSATNPTALAEHRRADQGRATTACGVWLEDQVGFSGPAADSADPPRHDAARRAAGPPVAAPDTPRARPRASTCAGTTSPTPARRSTPPTTRCWTPRARWSCRPRPSSGDNIAGDRQTSKRPAQRGTYTLRLWLDRRRGQRRRPGHRAARL